MTQVFIVSNVNSHFVAAFRGLLAIFVLLLERFRVWGPPRNAALSDSRSDKFCENGVFQNPIQTIVETRKSFVQKSPNIRKRPEGDIFSVSDLHPER